MSNRIYFVVEGEPLLSACLDWRKRYPIVQSAYWGFARKHGAQGYFPGFLDDLCALTVVQPLPTGWKIAKTTRNQQRRMVPSKDSAGKAIAQEIADLPTMPRTQEIADLLGLTGTLRFKHDASGYGFTTVAVGFSDVVKLAWTPDTTVIIAPDLHGEMAEFREKDPNVLLEPSEWSPPPGLRRISKAELDLIFAQDAVARERAALARAAP